MRFRFDLCWLEKVISRENILKISSPKELDIIDWMYNSMTVVNSTLIFKSFQASGIKGDIIELHNDKILNARLTMMLDDYFKAGVLETPFEYMDEGEGRWMIS